MPKAKAFPLTEEGITQALERSLSPEAHREYIDALRARLAEFERRHQMKTASLREALRSGALKETLDAAKWAMVADVLERLEGETHGRQNP